MDGEDFINFCGLLRKHELYINSLRLPCLPGETTGGWCWSTRQHIPEHSNQLV